MIFAWATARLPSHGGGRRPSKQYQCEDETAFQTIAGTLEQIDGNVYVVAEYITNYRGEEIKDKEMSVQVSSETKLVNGTKNVGDSVRIDVTSTGMANSIE
jgi:hypothetical protein